MGKRAHQTKQYQKKCSKSLIIGEMQTKTTRTYNYIPLGRLKLKRLTIRSAGENVEHPELSRTAGRNAKWCSHSRTQLAVSYKTKHAVRIKPNNFTRKYLPKRNKNMFTKSLTCDCNKTKLLKHVTWVNLKALC